MKICEVEGETRETGIIDPQYKLKMDKYLSSLDMKDSRYSILSYPQVKRLSNLMNETIPIHGRGNFPTLEVKLVGLVVLVKSKLEAAGIPVMDIRLNGSVASSVLAVESNIEYNDMDLIFSVELNSQRQYEKVKQVVLDALLDLLPEGTSKERMSGATLKEAYVSKMVKVTEADRWSLIALGNNRTKSVELKFVDEMKRKYEFSVDSFHIILDTLFLFYECSKMSMSENFYPTVVGESVYGDFSEALYHLEKRLIATKHPEQIRGGGLLKYCNLLVKNYRPAEPEQVKNMERYMCSRFFIDFPDLAQQRNKLIKFLDNHFLGNDDQLKYDYLTILYQVVNESTVCLMGHERRLTLALIEALSCNVFLPYSTDTLPISNSNWCNSSSCGTLNQICNSSSASGSCHSSRSSPAPCSNFSSPGSSSSYPSPAPSNTPSSYASPSPSSSTSNINNNHQSYATTPTHSINSPSGGGGHYSPMSAASVSPQSMSPKPATINGCVSGESTEWRMVPISWVTISPANVGPPPPPGPPHTTTTVTVETCSGGQTTNHSVTYHQLPVRSITTAVPPPTSTASGNSPQQQHTAAPPPPPPPPAPVTIVTTSAPPPPLSSSSGSGGQGGEGCVPRYEIITTCPPAQVFYSTGGNYYTAFLKPGSEATNGQPCYTCSCTCQASLQWTIAPNQAT